MSHQGQPVYTAGAKLDGARAAMIMIHGRGATARDILSLTAEFGETDFAYLAPQAANNAWYPNRFMEPIASNEPWLSSALEWIEQILAQANAAGIPTERTMLLGFSQGACLTTEFVARHAKKYGGVAALSGGLIGPDDTPRDYRGSLDGTRVFFGCSDADFHIPKERVIESGQVLERLGAQVTVLLYPNMGHEVNRDELRMVRQMMTTVLETK